MNDEIFCKTFCLIHKSGALLYPVKMKDRDTGHVAFRISKGGAGGNTKAASREENDEALVRALVLSEGWAVRAESLDKKTKGLYKLGQRSITGYKDLL